MLDAFRAFDKAVEYLKIKASDIISNVISPVVTDAAEHGFFSVDTVVSVADFDAKALMEWLAHKLTCEYGYKVSYEVNLCEAKLFISWETASLPATRD